ncbi:hypothetical protein ACUY4Q_002538 [Phytobacter sp. AG2a]|jgi:hypothetical protein
MGIIRELSKDEIMLVSGGGNSGDHDSLCRPGTGARNSLGRNAPTHIYSDPKTVQCASGVCQCGLLTIFLFIPLHFHNVKTTPASI